MNALLLPVEYCTRVSERPLADGGRAALHRVRGCQRLEVPLRHAADGAIVARDRAVLSLDVADPPVKVGRVAPSVRPAESTAFLPSKNGLFEPFVYENEHFTKTGSGQTQGKHSKRVVVF